MLAVPTGVSFVPDGGTGILSNGTVQWTLGTLAPGAAGQVDAEFNAPPAGSLAAMLLNAKLVDGSGNILAEASGTKSIYATPDFSYSVTTPVDPVKPGDKLAFIVKLDNLTNGLQNATLYYVVPGYTNTGFQNVYAGAVEGVAFSNVPAHSSQSKIVSLNVLNSGLSTPPEGTIIDLSFLDAARNATFSRNVVVSNQGPGRIQLSQSSYSIGEGGGSMAIVVKRVGGSSGAVSAKLSTVDGTATAGHDYTAVINRLVSFASGDTADKRVSIPITQDSIVEAAETFNVTLSAPTGGVTLGAPSSAIVTITDDDTAGAGGISIEQPAGTILTSGSSTVDLGAAILRGKAPLLFTIKNTGTGNLSKLAAKVTGVNASDFIATAPRLATLGCSTMG